MKVKPCCVHTWKNGMYVSSKCFKRGYKKEPSDVIELEITPGKRLGKTVKFRLNIEDATAIIHCLSVAMVFAIEQRSPVGPKE